MADTNRGPSLTDLFADRVHFRQPSIIRELLPLANQPGVISLGGGYPNPFCFPLTGASFRFGDLQIDIDGGALTDACQYGPSEGLKCLVEDILGWHEYKSKTSLKPENVCILNGAQEGLFLAAQLFLNQGDSLLMSEPVYPGAVSAFRCFTDNIIPVPQDKEGVIPESLSECLERRRRKALPLPKLLYLNSNCQNPAGISISKSRRENLLEIASSYSLAVIEDDPYEMLTFHHEDRPPTMQSLSGARVLRLDSFSKVFVPGFRLGYMSGPPEIMQVVKQIKGALNIHSSGFNQMVLEKFLKKVGYEGLNSRIRDNMRFYHENYQSMEEALGTHLKGRVQYNRPDGGFFVWVEILSDRRKDMDTKDMILNLCKQEGVLAMPGSGFSITGAFGSHVRLSYSQQTKEDIKQGIQRLSRMIDNYQNT